MYICTLYSVNVRHAEYSVWYTLYTVHCTVFNVQCTVYSTTAGVLYDPCPQLADVDHALLCPPSEKAEQQELALKVGGRFSIH